MPAGSVAVRPQLCPRGLMLHQGWLKRLLKRIAVTQAGCALVLSPLLGFAVHGCGTSETDPRTAASDAAQMAAGGGQGRCLLCQESAKPARRSDAGTTRMQTPPTRAMDDAGPDDDAGSDDSTTARLMPAPIADECITDVTPGDHAFTCEGVGYQVMLSEPCTRMSCGLVFEIHGTDMTAATMRANTRMHELAPSQGFIVVHPNSMTGNWDIATDGPRLARFMTRTIAVFHVDPDRVHVTGFGMGAAVTFWFLCTQMNLLASAAPASGSASDPETCIASIDANWTPQVPILFMSGIGDTVMGTNAARARVQNIVRRLSLTGGEVVDGDASFTRKRWHGNDGMEFDYLEHSYKNSDYGGHCIPGGAPPDGSACATGGTSLDWGSTALRWMIEHPRH